jgi:hypothetical protein
MFRPYLLTIIISPDEKLKYVAIWLDNSVVCWLYICESYLVTSF